MKRKTLGMFGCYRFIGALASRRKISIALIPTALMIIVILIGVYVYVSDEGGQKPTIKIHDGQWDSIRINNAIAEFIIEKGYGYPVETVVQTTQVMQMSIQKGEIDLVMEIWSLLYDWRDEQIEEGNIVDIGMTVEAGPEFFIIPQWVAEQYNIKTVFDMKDHWQLFKDPENPSKGLFYNGIIGWAATKINVVKLEAYGLTKYYNIISPGSSDALETALARAQMNRQPVFGYYFAPNALMGAYDWYILEEPPYTDECWEKIGAAVEDESLRPIDNACAYQTSPLDKVAHKGMLEKAPDVVEMLEKMVVGLEPLNEILAWAKENNVQNWEEAAIYYLQNYENRWETWVTPEAHERINESLEEASG